MEDNTKKNIINIPAYLENENQNISMLVGCLLADFGCIPVDFPLCNHLDIPPCKDTCSDTPCSDNASTKPSNPSSYPIAKEKGTTYITIELKPCTGATSYNLFYRKQGTSSWTPIETYTTIVEVSPLESGTSYEFKYSASNNNGTSNESSISIASTQITNTKPPTPTTEPRAIIKGTNYLDLEIDYVVTATSYTLYYRIEGTSTWGFGSTTTNKITIKNLKSNTRYELCYSATNSFGESSKSTISVATTANPPIEKWNWSFSTASGSNFTLSASEWIQFLNAINTVRLSKKLTEYSFTIEPNYVSKGKNFTASLFRQACNAINDMVIISSECLNVKSGDVIYGRYFEELKNKLNSLI